VRQTRDGLDTRRGSLVEFHDFAEAGILSDPGGLAHVSEDCQLSPGRTSE
jgi:hypothetical protein